MVVVGCVAVVAGLGCLLVGLVGCVVHRVVVSPLLLRHLGWWLHAFPVPTMAAVRGWVCSVQGRSLLERVAGCGLQVAVLLFEAPVVTVWMVRGFVVRLALVVLVAVMIMVARAALLPGCLLLLVLVDLSLSSSSIGYATPEGIAEANLQPHVRCLWLGGVQRSLDRGPKLTQLFNLVHPIQCALISRDNGQEELAEERLTCGNLSSPTSTCDFHMSLASHCSHGKNSMPLAGSRS